MAAPRVLLFICLGFILLIDCFFVFFTNKIVLNNFDIKGILLIKIVISLKHKRAKVGASEGFPLIH